VDSFTYSQRRYGQLLSDNIATVTIGRFNRGWVVAVPAVRAVAAAVAAMVVAMVVAMVMMDGSAVEERQSAMAVR